MLVGDLVVRSNWTGCAVLVVEDNCFECSDDSECNCRLAAGSYYLLPRAAVPATGCSDT